MSMERHDKLGLGGWLSRLLGKLLARWKLLLVIAFFASPIGPHLRVYYTYQASVGQGIGSGPRHYVSCTYLGSRGFITPFVPGCPVVAILDARRGGR